MSFWAPLLFLWRFALLYNINILGFSVPGYSLAIIAGLVAANIAAAVTARRERLDGNDIILLEAYIVLGALIGAKLLYIAVSAREIDWSRITDRDYLTSIMLGGFVFYGGLFGALAAAALCLRIHRIPAAYIGSLLYMFPLVHGFGRVGCFLAGCCYGMEYSGPLAVRFPAGSMAPAGVSLFPVQLLEAALLFALAAALAVLKKRLSTGRLVVFYLAAYSAMRFCLEFLRADAARGVFFGLSTSQWISLATLAVTAIFSAKYYIAMDKGRKS